MLPVHGDMLSCFFNTKNTWGPDCKGVNYLFLAEYADDLSKWGEKLQPYEACFFISVPRQHPRREPWHRLWAITIQEVLSPMEKIKACYCSKSCWYTTIHWMWCPSWRLCSSRRTAVVGRTCCRTSPSLSFRYCMPGSEDIYHAFDPRRED